MRQFYLSVLLTILSASLTLAQNNPALTTVKNYLNMQAQKLGLDASDYADLRLQTNYTNEKNNLQHVYVQQNIGGYPVYNAIANFALKNNQVVHMNETFEKKALLRMGNQQAVSDVNSIAEIIAEKLGLRLNETAFLNTDFTNSLMYFPTVDGKLNLTWIVHLNIKLDNELKILEVVANAQTGEIYHQHNHLLNCTFDGNVFENPMTNHKKSEKVNWLKQQYISAANLNDNAQYRVYEFPVEAPSFGDRTLLVNPADPFASPFGWHDTDGVAGHESTLTSGNNVKAVNDKNSAGLSWLFVGTPYTFTGYADGGSDLNFDFPIDLTQNMYDSADASTTNLFYLNNMMHDVWYQYGFTEPAGNFQLNNYGNDGAPADEVYAFGQTGEVLDS